MGFWETVLAVMVGYVAIKLLDAIAGAMWSRLFD